MFTNIYVKECGNLVLGTVGYTLGFRFGSDVKKVSAMPEYIHNIP